MKDVALLPVAPAMMDAVAADTTLEAVDASVVVRDPLVRTEASVTGTTVDCGKVLVEAAETDDTDASLAEDAEALLAETPLTDAATAEVDAEMEA